ncbi:Protein DEHYDRATION-INDUCED 19, partial [Cucurbita argyrosperma subsp. sororia]
MESEAYRYGLSAAAVSSRGSKSQSHFDFDYEEVDEDDGDLNSEYSCPFCSEEFDLVELCCHIDDEHPLEANFGICPICSSSVGENMPVPSSKEKLKESDADDTLSERDVHLSSLPDTKQEEKTRRCDFVQGSGCRVGGLRSKSKRNQNGIEFASIRLIHLRRIVSSGRNRARLFRHHGDDDDEETKGPINFIFQFFLAISDPHMNIPQFRVRFNFPMSQPIPISSLFPIAALLIE